jgi:hypothetical protein
MCLEVIPANPAIKLTATETLTKAAGWRVRRIAKGAGRMTSGSVNREAVHPAYRPTVCWNDAAQMNESSESDGSCRERQDVQPRSATG